MCQDYFYNYFEFKLPSSVHIEIFKTWMGFRCVSACKESACSVRDLGLIPGLGRSPGEGKGYPFQYSGLENSMDCIVHGVTKSQTRLNDFHFTSLQDMDAYKMFVFLKNTFL